MYVQGTLQAQKHVIIIESNVYYTVALVTKNLHPLDNTVHHLGEIAISHQNYCLNATTKVL